MSLPPPATPQTLRDMFEGIRFLKATGPAGDWIVFYHETAVSTLTQDQVIALCDRRNGVGATGVVVVTGASQRPEHSTLQHRLVAWQSDGSLIDNMTEPARAATSALAALDRIDVQDTSHHEFQTSQGVITTVYTPAHIGVDIGQWSYTSPDIAQETGSDVLVMAAGLTDPRPGLSIDLHHTHVTIAVESLEELEAIELDQKPSLEPADQDTISIGFVVPQDPVVDGGMGQLMMRHYSRADHMHELGAAAAAATVAFQNWSSLHQLKLWHVATPLGQIVVQLHNQRRLSTYANVHAAFFGRF